MYMDEEPPKTNEVRAQARRVAGMNKAFRQEGDEELPPLVIEPDLAVLVDGRVEIVVDAVTDLGRAVLVGGIAARLRRLLRRAARYARKIGQDNPFMFRVVDTVIDVMANAYPELTQTPDIVKKVIKLEEEAYDQTLGAGLQRLE